MRPPTPAVLLLLAYVSSSVLGVAAYAVTAGVDLDRVRIIQQINSTSVKEQILAAARQAGEAEAAEEDVEGRWVQLVIGALTLAWPLLQNLFFSGNDNPCRPMENGHGCPIQTLPPQTQLPPSAIAGVGNAIQQAADTISTNLINSEAACTGATRDWVCTFAMGWAGASCSGGTESENRPNMPCREDCDKFADFCMKPGADTATVAASLNGIEVEGTKLFTSQSFILPAKDSCQYLNPSPNCRSLNFAAKLVKPKAPESTVSGTTIAIIVVLLVVGGAGAAMFLWYKKKSEQEMYYSSSMRFSQASAATGEVFRSGFSSGQAGWNTGVGGKKSAFSTSGGSSGFSSGGRSFGNSSGMMTGASAFTRATGPTSSMGRSSTGSRGSHGGRKSSTASKGSKSSASGFGAGFMASLGFSSGGSGTTSGKSYGSRGSRGSSGRNSGRSSGKSYGSRSIGGSRGRSSGQGYGSRSSGGSRGLSNGGFGSRGSAGKSRKSSGSRSGGGKSSKRRRSTRSNGSRGHSGNASRSRSRSRGSRGSRS